MKLTAKDKILGFFDKSRKSGTLSHLYIIEGEKGIGKKTVVKYISAQIHCKAENPPCGNCSECVKHTTGNHPDYIVLRREQDKASISVDAVRDMISDMYIRPLISQKKIYVICDAETLSAQAQNALLKILEEPPEYVIIFMLVTNSSALLKTVLSRGILLTVPKCSDEQIKEFIRSEYPDKTEQADVIASFASGLLGSARQMAEGKGILALREEMYMLMQLLADAKYKPLFDIVSFFEKNKAEIHALLDLMHVFIRDAILIKHSNENNIINKDFAKEINDFAGKVGTSSLVRAADRIAVVSAKIGKGSNITLWITNLLIGCWEDFHGENYRSEIQNGGQDILF